MNSVYYSFIDVDIFQITVNDYKKLGQPWSVDFGNMFEFFARKDQRYNVQHTKDLYQGTQTLQQWVCENKEKLKETFSKI